MRLIAFPLVACSILFAQAPSIAMVSDLKGHALLEGQDVPIQLLREIPSGKKVTLDAGANVTLLVLSNGEELKFAGPGKFQLGADGTIGGLQPAQRRKALPTMSTAPRMNPGRLAQASVVMRAIVKGPKLLEPLGEELLTGQPRFRMTGLPKDGVVRLKLSEETGPLLLELVLEKAEVVLPAHLSLEAGKGYAWSVEITVPDEKTLTFSGKLRLAPEEVRTLAKQATPPVGAPFSARLTYAAMLESMGLRDDAKRQWKALYKERPESSELAPLAAD